MKCALEVNGLTYHYPEEKKPAVEDISFSVENGETFGIIGPSGSGKSTIMLALSGLIPHAVKGKLRGKVLVNGKDTQKQTMAELSQVTQILFQSPESQLFALNVEDEITFGLENLAMPWEEIERRMEYSVKELKIEHIRQKSIEELSSGQKQRVALASILAMKPSILLFDEPTANLDIPSVRRLENTIRQLSKKHTVVIVEHNVDLVKSLCTRTLLVDKGRAVLCDEVDQVLKSEEYKEIMLQPQGAKETVRKLRKIGSKPTREPVLKVQGLSFSYPSMRGTLHDIDLEIGIGDFVGITGLNGSGKSTLALNIIGILKGEGKIFFKDEEISKLDTFNRTKKIGYVFQNPNYQLFEDNLVREIGFGPANLGLSDKEVRKRVREALEITHLTGFRKNDPHALSVGQKRRVSIASVLAMKPELLIIDEPDTGLDFKTARAVLDYIKELNGGGMTIIMISHNLALVAEYCNRVIGMKDGRIVDAGEVYKEYFRQ